MGDERRTGLEEAAERGEEGLVREFVRFLREEKKWWLVPILLAVAVVGVLALAAATGAAPFIYTLF